MSERFKTGDKVQVNDRLHKGHHRTPLYLKGHAGVIDQVMGEHRNPETMAYGADGKPTITLYRVKFEQPRLWPDYHGPAQDTLVADLFEHWLEAAP